MPKPSFSLLASQRQALEAEREAVNVQLQAAHDRIQQLEAAANGAAQQIAGREQLIQERDATIAELRGQLQDSQRQREALEVRVVLVFDVRIAGDGLGGNEGGRLDVQQRGRDQNEVAGHVKVEILHALDLG